MIAVQNHFVHAQTLSVNKTVHQLWARRLRQWAESLKTIESPLLAVDVNVCKLVLISLVGEFDFLI